MGIKYKIDYLFLVEHEDRERYIVQRVANGLAACGKKSLIVSMEFYAHIFKFIDTKYIILPYAISSETWPINFMKKSISSAMIVSLNWEQLLSSANQSFKRPKDKLIKNRVKHLSWSLAYKEYLITSGVVATNIEVIGNPLAQVLYEFSKESNSLKVKLQKEFNLSVDKEILFFPMNYGWAFHSDRVITKKIRQGYSDQIAHEYRLYSQRCLESFCYFVKDVLRLDKFNIIIRPHPAISESQYLKIFDRLIPGVSQKVTFSKKYTIKEWIAVSDMVASSWSTAVWDAANIGKKVFLFTPFKRPDWLNTWWNDLVPNVQQCEQIFSVTKNSKESGEEKKYLSIIPGIVNWLNDLDENGKSFNFDSLETNMNKLEYIGYYLRGATRFFLMKYLAGLLVKKGLRRDFFEPILIEP